MWSLAWAHHLHVCNMPSVRPASEKQSVDLWRVSGLQLDCVRWLLHLDKKVLKQRCGASQQHWGCRRCSGEHEDSLLWPFSTVAVDTWASQRDTFCHRSSLNAGKVTEGLFRAQRRQRHRENWCFLSNWSNIADELSWWSVLCWHKQSMPLSVCTAERRRSSNPHQHEHARTHTHTPAAVATQHWLLDHTGLTHRCLMLLAEILQVCWAENLCNNSRENVCILTWLCTRTFQS